tara:strand:- start:188 stop:745 length:558 start_codon:yes stop_codon:yes gene_type:complete
MSLNKFFERKILFSFGRSFWNFVAFVGLIIMIYGGTILIYSYSDVLKSSETKNQNFRNYSFDSSYEDFIYKVKQGNINRVLIYPESGIALFVKKDGDIGKVVLKKDQNLISTLRQNDVQIASAKLEDGQTFKSNKTINDERNKRINKFSQRSKGFSLTIFGVSTLAITSVISSVLSTERNTRGNK